MSLLEVKLEVKIDKAIYISEGSIFAELELYLPADSGDYSLLEPLVSYDHKVLGTPLSTDYGSEHYDSEAKLAYRRLCRSKRFPLEPESVQLAIDWLNEQSHDAIATLNEVVNRYIQIIELIPEFEQIKVILPLPVADQ